MNPADIRLLRAQIKDSGNRQADWVSVPIHRLESLLDALEQPSDADEMVERKYGVRFPALTGQGAFRCSECGENDAEVGGMCVSKRCPREHEGFTEVRWFKPL